MKKIVQKDDVHADVLRATAELVTENEFDTSELTALLEDMREALEGEDDGVALAAPQIGVSKRIFIVSPIVFSEDGVVRKSGKTVHTPKQRKGGDEPLVYINPVILRKSKDKEDMEEGCLSVRWIYGLAPRATRATVRARDEHGNTFTRGARGLLAQIFQHETDHLNGILFTDTAHDMRDVPPQDEHTID